MKKEVHEYCEQPKFTVVEPSLSPTEVWDIYKKFGRTFSESTFQKRYNHNLRFFVLLSGGRIIATTWILHNGARFIDEVGLRVQIPESSLWLRDVFVAPQERGRQVFSKFLDSLINVYFPDCKLIYSDLISYNFASQKAHQRYGFKEIGEIAAIRFAGCMLYRRRSLDFNVNVSGYKKDSKLILMNFEYRKYRALNLA